MLNIIVVCTGNSCRSLLGEALFNHLGKGRIQAVSAGSHPLGRLNAGAVATLERHGISTEGYKSQSWDEFVDHPLDIAITVCDNAAGEVCPVYMTEAERVHWGLEDPGHVEGTEEEKIAAFEKTYGILQQRINKVLELPLEDMSVEAIATELRKMVGEA